MNANQQTQLIKYMMTSGYYDTAKIREDEGQSAKSAKFWAIFGDDDEQQEGDQSELLQAAEIFNQNKENAFKQREQNEIDHLLSAEITIVGWQRLVELDAAIEIQKVNEEENYAGSRYELLTEYAKLHIIKTSLIVGSCYAGVVAARLSELPTNTKFTFTDWTGKVQMVNAIRSFGSGVYLTIDGIEIFVDFYQKVNVLSQSFNIVTYLRSVKWS